jgi:hypothetical protein
LYKAKNEVALSLLPIHPGLALFPWVDLRRQGYPCTRGGVGEWQFYYSGSEGGGVIRRLPSAILGGAPQSLLYFSYNAFLTRPLV